MAVRDPLHGQPLRQVGRALAVSLVNVMGRIEDAWEEVVHNLGRARFVPAFRLWPVASTQPSYVSTRTRSPVCDTSI